VTALRILAWTLAAAALAASAAAQEAPLRLTLEEAIARAQQNSARVAGLRARVDAAEAATAGRAAADRPALALLGGYTRTNHVDEFLIAMPPEPPRVLYPDAPDNYRARLDLQWPIYTAGRTAALERAGEAERAAAAFDVIAGQADVRLEATRAFWALVTARQSQEVVERALTTSDAHVSDLRSRLDQGLIAPNELLSAEAQRSHERLLAIEAANLRGVAEADLRRVMGEEGRTAIEPVVPSEPSPGAGPAPAERAITGGPLRAEQQAVASRVAAAREREAAVAAAGKPQVAVGAGYDYARPNPRIFPRLEAWRDSWDVSVNVSWSLWDGGRRRAEAAEAAAGTRALLARRTEIDRDVAFEVESRQLEVQSARAAVPAADDGVRAAQEALRVVNERFGAGVATSTDVLDAQTALLRAELDRTRASAALRLADARLERALGR
jgi:outer membrane protein TolC